MKKLADETTSQDLQAESYFSMWQIGERVEFARKAGKLYSLLYKNSPKYIYRQQLEQIKIAIMK